MSPATRWLLFDSGRPLVANSSDNSDVKPTIAFLTTDDVKPLLGSSPFFGQGKEEGQLVVESSEVRHSTTEAARHRHAPVVFLGLDEPSNSNALPSSDFVDPDTAIQNLGGTPYFSMDVSELDIEPEQLKAVLDGTSQGQAGQTLSWSEPRALMTGLDRFHGAIFAEARSLVDWNLRNKVSLVKLLPCAGSYIYTLLQFCPGCGSSTYSMWGGWKIVCSSLLPWADNTGRKPCLSRYLSPP